MGELREREVVLLDGQTTGSTPAQGRLLEVAWAVFRAGGGPPSESARLLRQPAPIPRAITALTGIRDEDLAEACDELDALDALRAELGGRPLVIHYAQFERRFLDEAWGRLGYPEPPPAPLCTYEVARRLLPGLPGRGLRPLAAYVGAALPELKRAGDYVRASAQIWSALVELLEEQGVEDWEQLSRWVVEVKPTKALHYIYAMPPSERLGLPERPGVYRMLGARGEVLYVGKATSLRSRVNAHFRKKKGRSAKALELVTAARGLDVTETGSALEAALLEADEIKRHEPPCNTALRSAGRSAGCDAARWFGPYSGAPPWEALGAMGAWVEAKVDAPPLEAWGLPARALEGCEEAWSQGWGGFVRAWGAWWSERPALEGLMALGDHLWRREAWARALSRGGDDEDEGAEEEARAPEPEVWTAARVQAVWEGVAQDAARKARKAAWLMRLWDGALGWEVQERGGVWRWVEWRAGLIVEARDVEGGGAAWPALAEAWRGRGGAWRPAAARLGELDLGAWDRLVVLTAELRRVARGGGACALALSDGEVLGAEGLREALALV